MHDSCFTTLTESCVGAGARAGRGLRHSAVATVPGGQAAYTLLGSGFQRSRFSAVFNGDP